MLKMILYKKIWETARQHQKKSSSKGNSNGFVCPSLYSWMPTNNCIYIKHTFEKNILQAKSIQLFSQLYVFWVINGPRLKNETFSLASQENWSRAGIFQIFFPVEIKNLLAFLCPNSRSLVAPHLRSDRSQERLHNSLTGSTRSSTSICRIFKCCLGSLIEGIFLLKTREQYHVSLASWSKI